MNNRLSDSKQFLIKCDKRFAEYKTLGEDKQLSELLNLRREIWDKGYDKKKRVIKDKAFHESLIIKYIEIIFFLCRTPYALKIHEIIKADLHILVNLLNNSDFLNADTVFMNGICDVIFEVEHFNEFGLIQKFLEKDHFLVAKRFLDLFKILFNVPVCNFDLDGEAYPLKTLPPSIVKKYMNDKDIDVFIHAIENLNPPLDTLDKCIRFYVLASYSSVYHVGHQISIKLFNRAKFYLNELKTNGHKHVNYLKKRIKSLFDEIQLNYPNQVKPEGQVAKVAAEEKNVFTVQEVLALADSRFASSKTLPKDEQLSELLSLKDDLWGIWDQSRSFTASHISEALLQKIMETVFWIYQAGLANKDNDVLLKDLEKLTMVLRQSDFPKLDKSFISNLWKNYIEIESFNEYKLLWDLITVKPLELCDSIPLMDKLAIFFNYPVRKFIISDRAIEGKTVSANIVKKFIRDQNAETFIQDIERESKALAFTPLDSFLIYFSFVNFYTRFNFDPNIASHFYKQLDHHFNKLTRMNHPDLKCVEIKFKTLQEEFRNAYFEKITTPEVKKELGIISDEPIVNLLHNSQSCIIFKDFRGADKIIRKALALSACSTKDREQHFVYFLRINLQQMKLFIAREKENTAILLAEHLIQLATELYLFREEVPIKKVRFGCVSHIQSVMLNIAKLLKELSASFLDEILQEIKKLRSEKCSSLLLKFIQDEQIYDFFKNIPREFLEPTSASLFDAKGKTFRDDTQIEEKSSIKPETTPLKDAAKEPSVNSEPIKKPNRKERRKQARAEAKLQSIEIEVVPAIQAQQETPIEEKPKSLNKILNKKPRLSARDKKALEVAEKNKLIALRYEEQKKRKAEILDKVKINDHRFFASKGLTANKHLYEIRQKELAFIQAKIEEKAAAQIVLEQKVLAKETSVAATVIPPNEIKSAAVSAVVANIVPQPDEKELKAKENKAKMLKHLQKGTNIAELEQNLLNKYWELSVLIQQLKQTNGIPPVTVGNTVLPTTSPVIQQIQYSQQMPLLVPINHMPSTVPLLAHPYAALGAGAGSYPQRFFTTAPMYRGAPQNMQNIMIPSVPLPKNT